MEMACKQSIRSSTLLDDKSILRIFLSVRSDQEESKTLQRQGQGSRAQGPGGLRGEGKVWSGAFLSTTGEGTWGPFAHSLTL
jgi:hypothetical protein